MKRDIEATAKRHFKDEDSYVTKDGRDILCGEDWQDRKFQLLTRARGQCEYILANDERCLREGVDPHHWVLRSTQRNDALSALMLVCRHHHQVLDAAQRKIHGKNKIHFNPDQKLPARFANRLACEEIVHRERE